MWRGERERERERERQEEAVVTEEIPVRERAVRERDLCKGYEPHAQSNREREREREREEEEEEEEKGTMRGKAEDEEIYLFSLLQFV